MITKFKNSVWVLIVCSFLFISLLVFVIYLYFSIPKNPINNNTQQVFSVEQTINDINWIVSYNNNKNIVSISANYSENDKSSKYWNAISFKYGDHSLVVKHNIELKGLPMADENWYKIEKYETYTFNNELLAEYTTRYEEKLIFNYLS